MPLIQHVYPWDSQPQEAVGVNWDNPITRGLVGLWLSTPAGPRNYVDSGPNGGLNGAIYGVGAQGPETAFSGWVRVSNFGTSRTTNNFTVGCLANITDSASSRCLIAQRGTGTGTDGWVFTTQDGTVQAYVGTFADSGIAPLLGSWQMYGFIDRTSSSRIFVGKQQSAPLSSNSVTPSSDLSFGAWDNGSVGVFLGSQALWFVFGRPLETVEWESLVDDPWQLFAPRVQYMPTLGIPTSGASILYWIAHPTSSFGSNPTGAQIAAGNLQSGSAADHSGSEGGLDTSAGTRNIDEVTALTGLTAGVSYTIAATIYDSVALTYSAVTVGTVTTSAAAGVTSDLGLSYTVLGAAQADLVLAYTVVGSDQRDLALAYSVIGEATRNLSLVWTVFGPGVIGVTLERVRLQSPVNYRVALLSPVTYSTMLTSRVGNESVPLP